MNNNTDANATSTSIAVTPELIQIIYFNYVLTVINYANLALLIYNLVLAIPQEVVYMWLSPKPFSIPNLLYIFTRYGSVVSQGVISWSEFLPLGSLCNERAYAQDIVVSLVYIGVQGLLIIRAYSLCRGNKVVVGVLALLFWGGFTLSIYDIAKTPGCSHSPPSLMTLAANICTLLTDLIVFCVCLWKIWDIWTLKREIGIRSGTDLASVLFNQLVSRFCFVIIFSVALLILDQFRISTAINIMLSIQHSLSAILIADFTLDLRQKNSAAIQAANITLPTIQIQSVANYIHQSILVEMGDHDIPIHARVEDDSNVPTASLDVEIWHEESAY